MKNYDKSFRYKLRLALAYRDALRNHLPAVSRRYIENFKESQTEAARRLKDKEVIEVAFFLTIPGMWKCDYLFRAMRDNPRFHPYIVIYPYSTYKGFSKDEINNTVERTRKFVADKGFEYYIPYDSKHGRWLDVKKEKNPDIVFFTTPYKDVMPQYFIYHFRDRLTCYVPYGFCSINLQRINYNLLFHNLVGLFLLETEAHRQFSIEYSRNKGENAVATGFPGTEVFLRKDYTPHDVWKRQERVKKRVIWAPHHSIDNPLDPSTFLLRCDDMVGLAEKYKDEIQWAFKPHQLLKFKLVELWGEAKTNAYYNKWATMENTQLEESSYVDLFLTSDAMIHDSGSFTTEYLFVNKPVMYLTASDKWAENPRPDGGSEMTAGVIERFRSARAMGARSHCRSQKTINKIEHFNPFGKESFKCHYVGNDVAQIDSFLNDVVIGGKDTKKLEREAFFERYLKPIDGMMPSEKIIDEITKKIYNN